MSTTLLYHGWGIRGYQHVRTTYENRSICFHIEPNPQTFVCANCRSKEVMKAGIVYRRFRAADIRSILAAGPGVPRHRDPGAQLVIGLPAVPVRPLAAYALEPVA